MKSCRIHTLILSSAILLTTGFSCGKPEQKQQINPQDLLEEHRFDMTLRESRQVADGVLYERMTLDRFGGDVHVLTLDMTKGVLLDACWADGLCPNPATNGTNNGKQLRETLSETLRRCLGEKVVGGINGDYYHTKGGITLSPHVEGGEPVFFGNPYELVREPAFKYGFTQFSDGSISFGPRSVRSSVVWKEVSIPVRSVNDTILALSPNAVQASKAYQDANVYTARLVEKPFPAVRNKIGTRALFLVAKASVPLSVNTGPIPSTVTAVLDGRSGNLTSAPFVTGKDEWVLQLTGESAAALSGARPGDRLDISFELSIDGSVKPVRTHIGGKYLILANGQKGEGYDDPRSAARASLIGATQDGKTVKLIASAANLTFPDNYELARKLGLYNALRLDGGGSTEMCLVNNGNVEILCPSSDSNGKERSNMNYIHVRTK